MSIWRVMTGLIIKIKEYVSRTYLCKRVLSLYRKMIVVRNPEKEMCRVYSSVFHRNPDLKNPIDIIEKIYWMQLHSDTTLWTQCADKYAMRDYVRGCGFENYLPRLLGKWEKPEDVDFNTLPAEFVIKTNNSCGTVVIVHDKSKLDKKGVCRKLRRWLKIQYGWSGAQLHYTRIHPCIIAEELLHQDEDQKAFSPESMVDFKVWCINGEPECVIVVYGRNRMGYALDLYDISWNRISEKLHKNGHFKYRETKISKPACLEEMLEIAQKLAKPFGEVRVDFYVVNNKPFIGELTFTTAYGVFTEDYYKYLGSKMDIKTL